MRRRRAFRHWAVHRIRAPVAACALLAAAACVQPGALVRGIRTADPAAVDRVELNGAAQRWHRLAVVPFDGASVHARPAAELAAVTLRSSVEREVLGPWAVAGAAGEPTSPDGLAATARDPARARALASRLGVDALLVGRVEPGGAVAELWLVDGSSGEAAATIRRAGETGAAWRGRHELAMAATRRALEDIVTVLRTPAGTVPSVQVGPPPQEPPQ